MEELTPETVRRRLGYMADAVSRGVTDPYEIAAQASQWYEALFSTLTKERHARRILHAALRDTEPRPDSGIATIDSDPAVTAKLAALRSGDSDSGIEALRALSDAATPGKWHSKADELQRQWSKEEKRTGGRAFRYLENGGVSTSVIERRDADFLAACANYVRERLSTPRTETSDSLLDAERDALL